MSRSFLLTMKSVSNKSRRDNQNTHFMFNNLFHDCAFCAILWKRIVESDRPQMITWLMRIACWITKAANTLRNCNTYCFSTAIIVVRTCLNVTFYVPCLYFIFLFFNLRFARVLINPHGCVTQC